MGIPGWGDRGRGHSLVSPCPGSVNYFVEVRWQSTCHSGCMRPACAGARRTPLSRRVVCWMDKLSRTVCQHVEAWSSLGRSLVSVVKHSRKGRDAADLGSCRVIWGLRTRHFVTPALVSMIPVDAVFTLPGPPGSVSCRWHTGVWHRACSPCSFGSAGGPYPKRV